MKDFKKLIIVGIFLLIIWSSLLFFLWAKADEITKHPCQVCAKVSGEKVSCRIGNSIVPISRTYYPNGEIEDEKWGKGT